MYYLVNKDGFYESSIMWRGNNSDNMNDYKYIYVNKWMGINRIEDYEKNEEDYNCEERKYG